MTVLVGYATAYDSTRGIAERIAARPVWLFSVSSAGDHRSFFSPSVARLSRQCGLKALGGRYGDHRDWDEIDGWADDIARQLRSIDQSELV